MAQQQQIHPIFGDIMNNDLGAVQQRVLAHGAVLEERAGAEFTPFHLRHRPQEARHRALPDLAPGPARCQYGG